MVQARTESVYLIQSNKEKCKELLQKNDLDENDMINFYISLHIVMEVSLNALLRNLSLMQIQKTINTLEIAKNIDKINFIDKMVLFIYNYRYKFGSDLYLADEYHSIIGKLRNFCEARNKLLHGHSIAILYVSDDTEHSETKELLSQSKINEQVNKFKYIFKGLRFYIDHIDSSITESGKDSFKREYLDDSFLAL
ncbi:MAG: hypothetical protein UT05_C0003G0023 [Parcubacteria group bacterium GW2011_GWF2_38_76]|nr:MAG: hypothetical protein UT05_C0003G0023 [Parcubacteria group bacterium GW2011_GWF2_38_76]HBM46203.1 hypothetical protein [Patescibacteria group bacterium]